jgi:hypothetical protein
LLTFNQHSPDERWIEALLPGFVFFDKAVPTSPAFGPCLEAGLGLAGWHITEFAVIGPGVGPAEDCRKALRVLLSRLP